MAAANGSSSRDKRPPRVRLITTRKKKARSGLPPARSTPTSGTSRRIDDTATADHGRCDRPTVEANADADGNGQLILDYNVQDISANEEGVRVEYMTDAGRAWLPCTNASRPISEATNNGLRGRMVWMPDAGWHHAFVRVFVRDRAGNETVLERRVERPRVAQNPIQLASNIPQQYQNRMASQASPNTTPGYIAPGPVPGFPAANPAAAVPAPALPTPTLPTPAQPAAPAAGYTPAPAASYAPTYSPAATPPVPSTAAPVPNIGAPNFAAQPMQGPGLGQGFATGPAVAPNQNLPPAQYNAGPTAPGMTAPNMPSAPAPGQGFGQGQAYVPGQLPPAGASAAPGQVGTGVPQFGPTSVQNGGAPFGTGAAPTPNTAGPSVGNLPFPAITGTSIPGTSSVPSPEAGDFPPMVGPGNAPPSSAPAAAATPRQQPLSASEAMRPLAPEEIQAEGSGQNPANNTFTSADSNGSGTNNVNVPDPAAAGISPELPPASRCDPADLSNSAWNMKLNRLVHAASAT